MDQSIGKWQAIKLPFSAFTQALDLEETVTAFFQRNNQPARFKKKLPVICLRPRQTGGLEHICNPTGNQNFAHGSDWICLSALYRVFFYDYHLLIAKRKRFFDLANHRDLFTLLRQGSLGDDSNLTAIIPYDKISNDNKAECLHNPS
jgi:hypothetical protein